MSAGIINHRTAPDGSSSARSRSSTRSTHADWRVFKARLTLLACGKEGDTTNNTMTPHNELINSDDDAIAQAPSTYLDPRFDFKAMRLSQSFAGGASRKTIVQIPVRKPGPFWWFRVHPDVIYHYETRMFEVKEDGELYMVTPDLQQELGEILVPKVLFPAITRQGVLFLCPSRWT